jgi:two-component system chemotaxis sensor kinase CheA
MGSYNEPMLEMFIFETNQSVEQLEDILLSVEKEGVMTDENINEIFRIMHTIKGSSSMMMFSNISNVTHSLEDLFYYMREKGTDEVDVDKVCELVFSTVDFINSEISRIEGEEKEEGDESLLKEEITSYLNMLKGNKLIIEKNDEESLDKKTEKEFFIASNSKEQSVNKYIAKVYFEEDCKMENIRAFTVIRNLSEVSEEVYHIPEDLLDDENSAQLIVENGLDIFITSNEDFDLIKDVIDKSLFVDKIELELVESYEGKISELNENDSKEEYDLKEDIGDKENKELKESRESDINTVLNLGKKKNIISVNVEKMDMLMDLVGEIVITESMVTKNPDLIGLDLENFSKAARQLRKLNNELQDIVMSIRMIEIGPTFHKMHRIVRDMNKKLNKNAQLIISGEETEVDKNIIDTLGEPLMHIIRNSLDHGIESNEDRIKKGKGEASQIVLEALNTGGEVLIRITDDGKGLDRNAIIEKARRNNILTKAPEDLSDKEVYSLILLPGFSTKENVTEYSGRGVGMDVVQKSIEKIGGSIQIESEKDKGTVISIKIPLTLAIIDGMKISVGNNIFTIPTTTIKESFRPKKKEVFQDTEGNEMIIIRGECYQIIRLHEAFKIDCKITDIYEGILVMVESEDSAFCVFADDIIGEQQVVVKPIPSYLRQYKIKNSGIAGCAILGNADISLILDIASLANKI